MNSKELSKIFFKKIKKGVDFEPFVNILTSKQILDLKYHYESNRVDVIPDLINMSFESLIKSAILNKYKEIEYTDNILDNINDDLIDPIEKQLKSIKYLFFGLNNYDNIEKILGDKLILSEDFMFYVGEYNDIKFYLIPSLSDIYLSNLPIVDFNLMKILYEEEIKENISMAVVTINCMLGEFEIIKLIKNEI
ncbi:hypothetical protein M0Q97_10505 [Candidatus Dojkabacteria bacterium]|nr:hypothetical protein [Candidatus Dojkabacteria bacterium]